MAKRKVRTEAARKAWQTRRRISAFAKAKAAEAASKEALRAYCEERRWRVAFFEGPTGSPRTGIVDAIVFRIDRKDADRLDVRLVQLKGGKAGVSGAEIARLKRAAKNARSPGRSRIRRRDTAHRPRLGMISMTIRPFMEFGTDAH